MQREIALAVMIVILNVIRSSFFSNIACYVCELLGTSLDTLCDT
jgi:hypothetical protein